MQPNIVLCALVAERKLLSLLFVYCNFFPNRSLFQSLISILFISSSGSMTVETSSEPQAKQSAERSEYTISVMAGLH